MTLTRLQIRPEPLSNNPRHEWLFACVEGLPPARQKRLIVQARQPEVGFIDDADAEIILDALGLRDA